MKRNPCFCLVLFLSVLLSAHAGNPFAGNYGGSIFVTPNGSSEVVFTTAALLVDDAGGISGGLAGSVDNAGNITWTTPNTYNFTNGIVTNGVMTSVSTSPSFSFRLAANFLGGNFVSGGTLLWRSPSTGGSYYNAVAYGNGRFVAVGYAGQTAVSTDGTNWGNVPMAKDRAELFDVAYGNGVFLAVGTNNPVLLSSNGISWTTNAVDNFSSVAFGGGKFLAVSPTGATFSSTDGVTWSAVAGAATAQNFIGVDYANGLFILFGSTGRFQTSADGVTWNTPRTNAVASFTSAGYVGGRWVLGGSFVPNVVFTNVTGSDQVATNAGFSVRGLNSGSNLLVAATGASYPPAFSTNGLVWNYGNGAQDTLRAVAYGSNVFVAVGNYIQSSGDGRGWALRSAVTPVAMANNPGVNTNFGIYLDGATLNDALGRRRAVRVGQGGVIEMRFLDATNGSLDFVSVYSPTTNTLRRFLPASSPLVAVGDKGTLVRYDAANEAWRTFASPTAADLYDAHLNSGGNYVVVGSGGTILSAFAAQPTNLTVRVSGTADNLYSVSESSSSVVVGYRVLVCGDNGTLLVSADGGVSWTAGTTGVTNRLIRATAGDVNNAAFAFPEAGGFFLATSNSGVSWSSVPFAAGLRMNNAGRYEGGFTRTLQSSLGSFVFGNSGAGGYYTAPTSPIFSSSAYGNGRFVLLAGNATAVSTNGVNWMAGRSETVSRFGSTSTTSLAYGQGIFVSVGELGLVETSVDGINWFIRQSSITNLDLTSVAYGNGRFVATGTGGTIFSSTNGVNWENYSFANPNGSVTRVAYGNGRFIAFVSGIGVSSRISTNGVNWTVGGVDSSMTKMIGFANGRFFGTGNNLIFTSTDGTSWLTRNPSANFDGNEVAWGGGRYVIGAGKYSFYNNGPTILNSSDTTNWFNEISPINGSVNNYVIAAAGKFVIYGDHILTEDYVETNSLPLITSQPAPANQSVSAGVTVVYSATATGGGSLVYRWLKDGVPLFDGAGVSGATTATLTLTGITPAAAASYQLSVANAFGSDVSQPAGLFVGAPPVILSPPLFTAVTNLATTNLTVTVAGAGPLFFQWYKNGSPVANTGNLIGANAGAIYFRPASIADEGDYSVVVTNRFGTATSATVHLTVLRGPTITALSVGVSPQPNTNFLSPLYVFPGQTISFSSTVDGTGPFSYQWRLGTNSNLAGATNSTFVIPSLSSGTNVATYSLFVTNLYGTALFSTQFIVLNAGTLRPDIAFTNVNAIQDVVALPDGSYLAGGFFGITSGTKLYKFSLATLSGGYLTNFNPAFPVGDFSPGLRSLAVLSDNSVVVGGTFNASSGASTGYSNLVHFLANGQFDTASRPVGAATIQKVIPLTGGKFLALQAPDTTSAAAVIRRFNADGTTDGSFTQIGSLGQGLWGLGIQTNGTIWYGANGDGLRKANSDGTGVTTVDSSFAGKVFVAPDDRIYFAPAPGGGAIIRRRNADGTTNSFAVTVNNFLYAMAFLPNGKIVIGGNFTSVNGTNINYLALLNDDGSLDPTFQSPFSPTGGGAINSILLLGDGSALLGTSGFNGVRRVQLYYPNLAIQTQPTAQVVNRTATATFSVFATGSSALSYQWRFNGTNIFGGTNAILTLPNIANSAAGNYDVVVSNSFGTVTSSLATLTVLGDAVITQPPVGQTLLAGSTASFSVAASGANPFTYQWRRNGTNIFGATSSVLNLTNVFPSDTALYDVVVGNLLGSVTSLPAALSVFTSTNGIGGAPGTLETNYVPTLTPAASASVLSVILDANNKVLVTGTFDFFNGTGRTNFVRLNSNLTVDTSAAPLPYLAPIPAVGLPGGGFALGGYFSAIGSSNRPGLAFFDASGTLQPQPVLSPSGYVNGGGGKNAFAGQPDGKILAGGYFTSVNALARTNLVRLNSDGSVDGSFVPAALDQALTTVAVQPDGKILIGGSFTTVSGSAQAKIARLNTNGVFDATFTNSFTIGTPYGFRFQSDGKILIFGQGLTAIGGVARTAIARLNTNGSLDTNFNVTITGGSVSVCDALVEADDKIVIVGSFTTVGGVARSCVARLNVNGSLDSNFANSTGAGGGSPVVYSVVKLPDTSYLIGGAFTQYDGQVRRGFAHLLGAPIPPPARAILSPPQPQTVSVGGNTSFTVAATGSGSLTYQWRKDGTNILNATNTTFAITNAQLTNAANYDVIVTDTTGSTFSQTAALTVISPLSFAVWITGFGIGGGLTGPLDDPDGDGLNNLTEYALGTNPNSAASGQTPSVVFLNVGGTIYPAVQFTRNAQAIGVSINVIASPVVTFNPIVAVYQTATNQSSLLDLVWVRSIAAYGTYPQLFFKVSVTQP